MHQTSVQPAHFRSPPSGRIWLGTGLSLGIALIAWWWIGHAPDPVAAAPAAHDQTAKAWPLPSMPSTQGQQAASELPPTDISPDDWHALQVALADHHDKDAELRRIVGLLQAQAQVRRFQALRHSGSDAVALRELALAIDDQLPGQLARSEITAGEARLLKARLLEVLEPNPTQQAMALAAWQSAEIARTPTPSANPRDVSYLVMQAQISGAWRALPESRRDPADLTRQLNAARQQIYAASSAGTSTPGVPRP